MTKEKLLDKCKELIDKEEYTKMQRLLLCHPKLLLKYFNELQTELADYARDSEASEDNKN